MWEWWMGYIQELDGMPRNWNAPPETRRDARGHISVSYSRVILTYKGTNSSHCCKLGFYVKAKLFLWLNPFQNHGQRWINVLPAQVWTMHPGTPALSEREFPNLGLVRIPCIFIVLVKVLQL